MRGIEFGYRLSLGDKDTYWGMRTDDHSDLLPGRVTQ